MNAAVTSQQLLALSQQQLDELFTSSPRARSQTVKPMGRRLSRRGRPIARISRALSIFSPGTARCSMRPTAGW